jgi:hypothetical protein
MDKSKQDKDRQRLIVYIPREIRTLLENQASSEHRSLTNLVEKLLVDAARKWEQEQLQEIEVRMIEVKDRLIPVIKLPNGKYRVVPTRVLQELTSEKLQEYMADTYNSRDSIEDAVEEFAYEFMKRDLGRRSFATSTHINQDGDIVNRSTEPLDVQDAVK